MYGHELRMRRIFPASGRRLFAVPLDHAVSMGPIDGLEESAATVGELEKAGIDLVIVAKGAVRHVVPVLGERTLLGVHLSAATTLGPAPDRKVIVGTPAEASALGADLVSVQVNFGIPGEPDMLVDLGRIADGCRSAGLPLLCMAYLKGEGPFAPEALRHATRAVAELGADIVKTSYPGSPEELRALVRTTPVPVLLGGGVRFDDEGRALAVIRDALGTGIAGICFGRNLFQRRPLLPFARSVAELVHGVPGSRAS